MIYYVDWLTDEERSKIKDFRLRQAFRSRAIELGVCRNDLRRLAEPGLKNCGACLAAMNSRTKRRRKRLKKLDLKAKVYAGYGNQCACCGEKNQKFLTIDHVYNDGAQDRKKGTRREDWYAKIIRENFPARYRLLCWNCNCGRAQNNGVCPHSEAA